MPALDVSEMRERLGAARRVVLVTLDPDGGPNPVPCCFALDGDILYSAVDDKPKTSRRLRRVANLERDPRVVVLADRYDDDWAQLWWVRVRGSGRIVTDGPDLERSRTLLARKYDQYASRPPGPPVVAVTLDDWRGWRA